MEMWNYEKRLFISYLFDLCRLCFINTVYTKKVIGTNVTTTALNTMQFIIINKTNE